MQSSIILVNLLSRIHLPASPLSLTDLFAERRERTTKGSETALRVTPRPPVYTPSSFKLKCLAFNNPTKRPQRLISKKC